MATSGRFARIRGWFGPAMLRRTVAAILLALAFAAGIGLGVWTRVCANSACPSIAVLEDYQPQQTSKVYAMDGRLITDLGLERRTVIRLEDMPLALRQAFVAVEDKRFYQHHGVDYSRVFGAIRTNLLAMSFSEGFSTITMQLARNVFPDRISGRERSGLAGLTRKLKEIWVARELEATYDKDRILELYLNQINLGAGAYGVETAAQRYFGKSARDLNLAESATLAMLPQRPSSYNPRRYPARAVQRRNLVLELMRQQGYISAEQAEEAKAYPLGLSAQQDFGETAPYFVEWLRQTLNQRFGRDLYERGLRVHTTLDIEIQQAAERALEAQLQNIEAGTYGRFRHVTFSEYLRRNAERGGDNRPGASPYLQGAMVVMDAQTGEIRAMVGGRDFDDSKFNRATQALRQPGSTFKLFVYSAALRSGHTPEEPILDEPISLPMPDGTIWEPSNFEQGEFRGGLTIRQALASSINLAAIRLGLVVGVENVVEEARRFGITTPIPRVPSIFVGSAEVLPLQLTAAYTVPASLGFRASPIGITRVDDADGTPLWQPQRRRDRVLSPDVAYVLNDMLRGVVRYGTASGAVRAAGFTLPAGGKTGTTNDYTDVWFCGYTRELVACVWIGMDNPQTIMPNAQGGRLAAPAWANFMREIYERRPNPGDWERPAGAAALMQPVGVAPVPINAPATTDPKPPKPPGTPTRPLQ
jgi:penicillin-binding protein 1A